MKLLLVSAFAESGRESGANRLRKLRSGLQELGCTVDWLGPRTGFVAQGKRYKLLALVELFARGLQWARWNPQGKVLLSLPPPWLLPVGVGFAIFFPGRLVVDFRDPLLNHQINPRGWLYRLLVGGAQRLLVARASLVVVVAKRIADHLPACAGKLVTVLAGVEESEVRTTVEQMGARVTKKVIYGGTFYGSRSPIPLLEALADYRGDLRFELYVSFNAIEEEQAVKALIQKFALDSRVQLSPLLPREQFLSALRGAGAGLVITHSEGSDYAIPGKIFDYATAGVTSWVVSQDRGLLDFLAEVGLPAVVTKDWNKAALLQGLAELEQRLELEAEQQGGMTATSLEPLYGINQARVLFAKLNS